MDNPSAGTAAEIARSTAKMVVVSSPLSAAAGGNYTSFETGEPNDGNGNSDCLRMITGGAWRDTDCAQELSAVCESQ